jgi:DNA-binding NarL/FixJ family response regulator
MLARSSGGAARMKILVVDDHGLVREALRGVLMELRADATIIEASNAGLALQRIEESSDVELVLLDLGLPDRDGFEVLAELRERYPAIAVVVLSAHDDRDNVTKALNLGALGFIPKSARREVMLSALNLVFAGGIYVPPQILGHPQNVRPQVPTASVQRKRRAAAADIGLTERQMDVLLLMMEGKSNKAICRLLDIAEPTVKNHVTAILRVLKVTNRTEAVIAAGALVKRI